MDQQPDPGIGARVRELRRARGLKQQDLAYGEISISYVSLIESGKRRCEIQPPYGVRQRGEPVIVETGSQRRSEQVELIESGKHAFF